MYEFETAENPFIDKITTEPELQEAQALEDIRGHLKLSKESQGIRNFNVNDLHPKELLRDFFELTHTQFGDSTKLSYRETMMRLESQLNHIVAKPGDTFNNVVRALLDEDNNNVLSSSELRNMEDLIEELISANPKLKDLIEAKGISMMDYESILDLSLLDNDIEDVILPKNNYIRDLFQSAYDNLTIAEHYLENALADKTEGVPSHNLSYYILSKVNDAIRLIKGDNKLNASGAQHMLSDIENRAFYLEQKIRSSKSEAEQQTFEEVS